MKSRRAGKPDPVERRIEIAFRPGAFIRDSECFWFVRGLDEVAANIESLTAAEPARAAVLYESFLAGFYGKAEELDDSSGGFGEFAWSLICRWISARQSAGADAQDGIHCAGVDGR